MDMLARRPSRVASRVFYGTAAYWTLNVALLLAEARWHILYRLTLWDLSQLKALGPVFYHAVSHHVAGI